jgi:hypothetical protein
LQNKKKYVLLCLVERVRKFVKLRRHRSEKAVYRNFGVSRR